MSTVVPDSQLDRLVDGELTDDARRRLLERLESEPAGWRRCALAFLEAQTLRETFRDPAWHQAATPAEESAITSPRVLAEHRAARPAASRWGWWLATAAGWLVMFGCGWWWAAAPGDGTQLARKTPDLPATANQHKTVETAPADRPIAPAMPIVADVASSSAAEPTGTEATLEHATEHASRQQLWQQLLDAGMPADTVRELAAMTGAMDSYETVVQVPLDEGWSALVPVRFVELELEPETDDYL